MGAFFLLRHARIIDAVFDQAALWRAEAGMIYGTYAALVYAVSARWNDR